MKTNLHFWSYLAHFFLEWENVADKSCGENENAHFVFNNLLSKNRAVYEIMSNNIVERGRPQMTVWRMACWMLKAIT